MTRAVNVGDTVAFALKRVRNGEVVGELLRNKGVVVSIKARGRRWPRALVEWEDKALAYTLTGSQHSAYIRDLRVINAD